MQLKGIRGNPVQGNKVLTHQSVLMYRGEGRRKKKKKLIGMVFIVGGGA